MKMRLLEIQQEHLEKESKMAGAAEGIKMRTFVESLGAEFSMEQKLVIFTTLRYMLLGDSDSGRKKEILSELSRGNSQLYFTPADVDISINSKHTK